MKTFNPNLDGDFQDECNCDHELSAKCKLRLLDTDIQRPIGFCICVCHIKMHEARFADAQKRAKQRTKPKDSNPFGLGMDE